MASILKGIQRNGSLSTGLFLLLTLACQPAQRGFDPHTDLEGDWQFSYYERDELDYSIIMRNLFVRIGPCDPEDNFCQAILVPFSTVPQEVLDFMDNDLEVDFHLRNPIESQTLAEELGFTLPTDCSPCYTIQDDIHDNHIYAGYAEGSDTLHFTLMDAEAEERFTMVRLQPDADQ